ncbi:unnamed protein product [Adineta ricciae]|uniref:Uncharacterized protein n=1 Tax=Adineta ricciae TaxID=249248 RepID=A0A815G6S1_ADIRI|nr:unnamed protein product [Adineta ricciae]CAF1420374.1 unnamed protein product [Adineta ricciae]
MTPDLHDSIKEYQFDTVIVFGDSLSDTNNVYTLTNGTWPTTPLYFQGRFCDSFNWVDNLRISNVKNYAHGGATTDSAVVQGYTKLDTVPVPGVRQQIKIYLDSTKEQDIDFGKTLYIISAGGNDLVYSKVLNPFAIVNRLSNAVNDLIACGAKHILIFNQPPAETYPYVQALSYKFVVKQFTILFNSILSFRLKQIQKSNSHISLKLFNLHLIIKRVVGNESGQFENTTDPCWDMVNDIPAVLQSSDPSKYVFIDKFHFTSGVHKTIADAIHELISSETNSFVYPPH